MNLLRNIGPRFDEMFVSWRFGQAGRIPKFLVEKHEILGLLHVHYCNQMSYKSLCQMFAIPPATLSRTLRNEIVKQEVLKIEPDVIVSWPSIEEQTQWGQKLMSYFRCCVGVRWL